MAEKVTRRALRHVLGPRVAEDISALAAHIQAFEARLQALEARMDFETSERVEIGQAMYRVQERQKSQFP